MPNGIDLISMKDILTFEEIVEVAKAASSLGITKLKITGGEPLVRIGCTDLIAISLWTRWIKKNIRPLPVLIIWKMSCKA